MKGGVNLRGRLAFGTLGIALILATPLAFAIQSIEEVHQNALELKKNEFAASLLLGHFREGVDNLRRADDALVIMHDSASMQRMAEEIGSMQQLSKQLEQYDLSAAATSVQLALDSLKVLTSEEYTKAVAGSNVDADHISSLQVRPRISTIEQAIFQAETALRGRTSSRVNRASQETADAERTALASLVIALALAVLISIWLIRSISRPITDLEMGMHAVAEGDFSHELRIPADRQDEFGRLAASYDAMARRLQELDKLKAEFISIASHELKTPINVILGYVELLQEGIYGRLSSEQREVCDTITMQANNLTRLVRRLLDVSRFEAGAGKLEVRPFKVTHLLETLESSFNVLAMQRGITFTIVRDDDLPEDVRWDEDRMNEVIGNLLSNAFKFTPRGGEVELSAMRADEHIQIQVRDTGAGIPPAQLPNVFQKFYQADNQSQANAKGTGLGLAIAKQIVEAHKGSISVESELGHGTTFTIRMPVRADFRRTGQFPVVPAEATV